MKERTLTTDQAETVYRTVESMERYLEKLLKRMDVVGIPDTNQLYRHVLHAQRSIYSLRIDLMYERCPRPGEEEPTVFSNNKPCLIAIEGNKKS